MLSGTIIKVVAHLMSKRNSDETNTSESQLGLTANCFVLFSGGAGVLLAMSRWLASSITGPLMLVMLVLFACTATVTLLTKDHTWRTTFRALIVAIAGSTLCILDGWLQFDGWHRLEIVCILGGAFLIALGHVAWYRENENDRDETATVSLMTGSILVVLPLAVGLLFHRLIGSENIAWQQFHEIGSIACGLLLLGSGLLCRLRSTTLAGGSLLAIYLASLIVLIRLPSQLQNISVCMMVGGGAFFAIAFLMSIYRDRLVSLPSADSERQRTLSRSEMALGGNPAA